MTRAVLLLLLGACGRYDFEPRADAVASSTRLKQVWNVFADGPRLPETIYDTQLDLRCDPQPTTSGLACLPRSFALPFYTDAACTQAIALSNSPDDRYAYDINTRPIAHVFELGAPTTPPATIYNLQFDGSCLAQPPSTGTWYATTEAPLSTFAPLTAQYGSEGRIVSQQLVASDGFHTPGTLHDTTANGDCIADAFDDATVCDLFPADLAENYTDNTCTHLVLDAYVSVSFAEEFVNTPVCKSTDIRSHAVATELPSTTPMWLEIPGSATCAAQNVGPGRRLYDLGPPITLATVTRTPVGTTRIQAIEDAAGSARANEYDVHDSQLGVECRPQNAADGVLRCLPSRPAYATAYFADAACTQPLMLAAYGQPACATLPPLIIEDPSGPRVYQAGAKYTLPFYYSATPGSCSLVTPSSDEYVLGAEIPPSSFATITEQTDP
jgi:hypothetical protein